MISLPFSVGVNTLIFRCCLHAVLSTIQNKFFVRVPDLTRHEVAFMHTGLKPTNKMEQV